MIDLLNGTAAFLKYGGHFLLMKRSAARKLAPNVWSGLGGKMEADELNNPEAACLREVYEESGITAGDVTGLRLRYIIIRRAKDVIRQSYIYFGDVNGRMPDRRMPDRRLLTGAERGVTAGGVYLPSVAPAVINGEPEGELHWIPEGELLNRTFSQTFGLMLEHYVHTPDPERVIVGTAGGGENGCAVTWAAVEDFE